MQPPAQIPLEHQLYLRQHEYIPQHPIQPIDPDLLPQIVSGIIEKIPDLAIALCNGLLSLQGAMQLMVTELQKLADPPQQRFTSFSVISIEYDHGAIERLQATMDRFNEAIEEEIVERVQQASSAAFLRALRDPPMIEIRPQPPASPGIFYLDHMQPIMRIPPVSPYRVMTPALPAMASEPTPDEGNPDDDDEPP